MTTSPGLVGIDLVVVGVDASETALAAAREAAELAVRLGAKLHIVTAVVSDSVTRGGSGSDSFTTTSLDRAEQTLADIASRLPKELEVTTSAAYGKAPG